MARLADRDGWVCWLCDGPIDPACPAGSPHAPTIDHVVPRSRGGRSVPGNLRLAHRRCNARRGHSLPELRWPAELGCLDAAPLWPAIARLVAKPGSSELVALVPTAETARAAAAWAIRRADRFVPGGWAVQVVPVGAADLHAVHLARDADASAVDVGRPVVTDARRTKQRRSRRGR